VYQNGLLSAARKKLPMFNGTKAGELTVNGGSASVKWRRIENLAVNTTPLAAISGAEAAFFGRSTVQPTVTDVTVAIAKYGQAITFNEELDLININTQARDFIDMMGANAGETLNSLMVPVYQAATNVRRANNVATDLTIITGVSSNDIRACTNILNRNSAQKFTSMGTGSTNIGTTPVRSSYYGIAHVDVEEDIRAVTGFQPVETYAGYMETEPFEIGAVNGVRWFTTELSALIAVGGATSAASGFRPNGTAPNDVYSSFIFGKEAVGTIGLGKMHSKQSYEMYNPKKPSAVEMIYKDFGSVGTDLYNEVASLAWKSWFAGKILNDAFIVHLKTLATRL
jgi:N4-gp56 family major capsid protein